MSSPICMEPFDSIPQLGRFTLRDEGDVMQREETTNSCLRAWVTLDRLTHVQWRHTDPPRWFLYLSMGVLFFRQNNRHRKSAEDFKLAQSRLHIQQSVEKVVIEGALRIKRIVKSIKPDPVYSLWRYSPEKSTSINGFCEDAFLVILNVETWKENTWRHPRTGTVWFLWRKKKRSP